MDNALNPPNAQKPPSVEAVLLFCLAIGGFCRIGIGLALWLYRQGVRFIISNHWGL